MRAGIHAATAVNGNNRAVANDMMETMQAMLCEPEQQLALWKSARANGEEVRLATMVHVEGSSYRRPGARMLVTRGGLRAGMVSGGCLESEICQKIWWLTESGAHVERYVTTYDEENRVASGLGCGGSIDVLFEGDAEAGMVMEAVRASIEERCAGVILSVIESQHRNVRVGLCGVMTAGARERFEFAEGMQDLAVGSSAAEFRRVAAEAFAARASSNQTFVIDGREVQVFAEYLAPPPALLVFGAGDDAKPLVSLARMIGWHVTVCDARSQLATRERFPGANAVIAVKTCEPLRGVDVAGSDAVVMMTHSFEQDRAVLRELLGDLPREGEARGAKYVGILGARRRTQQLVEEVAASLGLAFKDCMARLHSPVGLRLGAVTPETIALSIVAEIQGVIGQEQMQSSDADRFAGRLQDEDRGRNDDGLRASDAKRTATNAAARG